MTAGGAPDDVTIDCEGFTLDDGDLDALNEAVTATIYSNLTVRNCTFKGSWSA